MIWASGRGVTEISYSQHPPSLPLSPFQPLLSLARRSSLPFIRKLGNLVPIDEEDDGEICTHAKTGAKIKGVLRREEWDGAMRAWSEVEQRLGR